MASISDIEFASFRGRLLPATRRSKRITAPFGVTGDGMRFGGWVSEPQQIETAQVLTGTIGTDPISAEVQAAEALEAYRALEGQTVTVVDGFGTTWPGVLVVGVSGSPSFTVEGTVRLTATWSLRTAAAEPAGE